MKLTSLICAMLWFPALALAKPGDPLPQTALQQGVDYVLKSPAGLDRAFYFGGDNHTLVGTGEHERYIDPSYCAAADPVRATPGGGFAITLRVATETERIMCHLRASEGFVSGLVTTQHAFSATYGYWEVRANLPAAMGTWPAIWLLPTAKTAVNKGALPEIDVLEEYAGVVHGVNGFHAWSLDRTGRPISSVHIQGDGKALSCGLTSAYVKPGTWHTYGVLWEPTKLTFYVDEIATCEQDVAVSDPHYLLINLAMDGRPYTPGPDSPALYPATMSVDWATHRPLHP